jgi:hypothetical protein
VRSLNMRVLTNQIKSRHPGVVIYGIGDAAHRKSASGHNEDDTPGSLAEDQDADNNPEHRAIDVMIGPAFSVADGWDLVSAMVTIPENQRRLIYVIFYRKIWRRRNGWVEETYTGPNPHTDHPHLSGEADDDENTTPWVLDLPSPQPTPRRSNMATVYFNLTAKNRWALAGDSPGTDANWLETTDQNVANGWAAGHGNGVGLYQNSWDDFRNRYTAPLRVVSAEPDTSDQ